MLATTLADAGWRNSDDFKDRVIDLMGRQKLTCEMTVRDGRVVHELNGLSRPDWMTLPKSDKYTGDH